jgi:3-oxoadipate enol-lactonase
MVSGKDNAGIDKMGSVEVAHRCEGSGPPLYMVHGIGSRKEHWDPLIDAFKESFTCVSYDLRGHGESPVPSTPYNLDQLVEDLEALRTKLGHEQIHVIGHSLGGVIGPAYARAHPERLLSLGLFSTAAGRTDEDRAILFGVIEKMRNDGIPQTLDTFVNRWYTDEFITARPDVVETQLRRVTETPEDVFLSVFEIYASSETGPWLPSITCPCLVLTAEFDGGSNPRLNRFIDAQLPDSELVILPHLKHDILGEASDQIVGPLQKFLRRIS